MIHCKDCRFFEERTDLRYYEGNCLLTLPPWLEERIEPEFSNYRGVNETDGCDLGQPKEEKGE